MQNQQNPYSKPPMPPHDDARPRKHRRHFSFFRVFLMALGAVALCYLLARVAIYLLVMAQGFVGGVS